MNRRGWKFLLKITRQTVGWPSVMPRDRRTAHESMAEQWVFITFICFITSSSPLEAHSLFLQVCCWGFLLFLVSPLTLLKVFSFPLISQPPYPHSNYFREPWPYTVRDNSGVNLTQHGPVKQWQMLLLICVTIHSLMDHWWAWTDLQMKDIDVMQCLKKYQWQSKLV